MDDGARCERERDLAQPRGAFALCVVSHLEDAPCHLRAVRPLLELRDASAVVRDAWLQASAGKLTKKLRRK
jgi:hypothetical protein